MKKRYCAFLLCVFVLVLFCPQVEAGDWDRCKVCHRPSGGPGPSMKTLKEKYKTEDEFVQAALSSSTPMMAFVRQDKKLLHNVAKEIKIGEVETPEIKETYPSQGIDAKKIIEERCTTCHNINRVVYAPEYTTADWLHIVSRMEAQTSGLLSPEEMVVVVDWLYAHHNELKPVKVTEEEALISPKVPQETRDLLVQNKCIVCHADDKILEQAGAWTKDDWQHIIERMRARAPELLKNVQPVDIASHLFDQFGGLVRTGAKKVTELGDIYYRLYGNTQLWAEYQHAYDFNNDVDDDSGGTRVYNYNLGTGEPIRGGRITDQRRIHGFYETKNIVSAEVFDPSSWMVHGTFGMHILEDEGNDVLGKADPFFGDNTFRDESNDVAVDPAYEEAWVEVQLDELLNRKFGWELPTTIRIRGGIQDYMSDFIGSIYSDTDLGVRIYGNVEGIEWSLYGGQRLENDLVSGFNDDDSRDQEFFIAHMLFKIGNTAFKPSFHYNEDREGDQGNRRTGAHEEVETFYIGNTTYGPDPFGLGINILTGIYGVFGDQRDATVNGIDGRNIVRVLTNQGADYDTDQSVHAYLFYFDISRPFFNGIITPHTGLYYASGDNRLDDTDAGGFDSISDDVNVWGDRGMLIDDRFSIRARSLEPLIDPFGPLGGNNLTSPTNPFMPGRRLAASKSSSITILRENSPYPSLRDSDASSNFINPGVIAWNLGTGFKPLPWLEGNFNFTYFWFEDSEVLETFTEILRNFSPQGRSPWNPAAGDAPKGGITNDVGYEFSADANFLVNSKFSVFTGAGVFVPDEDNFEKLFGNDDVATDFMLGVQYKF